MRRETKQEILDALVAERYGPPVREWRAPRHEERTQLDEILEPIAPVIPIRAAS